MENSKSHLRYCILYEYQLGHSASEAARNICNALGEGSISHVTISEWFKRFNQNNYNLEDKPRSGRPPEVDIDQLQALVKSDPRQSTRCIATTLSCHHSTIARNLAQLGYRNLLGALVPHTLTPRQQNQRSDICMSLLSKHRRFEWLNDLITGDEKWVLYVNTHHTKAPMDRTSRSAVAVVET